ncbi:uncharacterized protein LOC125660043 [Ostrea edulis]|uniref:uncharacterized protein LOC125660043 n=1 Tax=Ostrea edulis TaxID=37623 RepID=UPI002096195C|nr:uncharacterized protein LOC125660043 [Ostrea edulis]
MHSMITIAVVLMAGIAVAMADGYGSSGYGYGSSGYMSYPSYGSYGYGKGYGKKHITSAVYYPVPVPFQQPAPAPLPLPPIGMDTGIGGGNDGGLLGGSGIGLLALLFLIPLLLNNNTTG